jgi:hypothetical protein
LAKLLLFAISLKFALCFPNFPPKYHQFAKLHHQKEENKKYFWLEEGFNPTI